MKISEMIRKKRKEQGMTQERVAAALGVTAPAVNKWEKGITCPDIALLPALARLCWIPDWRIRKAVNKSWRKCMDIWRKVQMIKSAASP